MSEFSFGIKLKFGEKKFKTGHVVYLRDISDNHNKYYHIVMQEHVGDEYPYQIRVDFGRISTPGNCKYHKFKEQSLALAFVADITKKKIKKGYKLYTPSKNK